MPEERPLFIPLKREHFDAFEAGTKREEYRLLGPRWNERTARIGRAVVLSCGYGKARRLRGIVRSVRIEHDTAKLPGFRECYGARPYGPALCIGIELEQGGRA